MPETQDLQNGVTSLPPGEFFDPQTKVTKLKKVNLHVQRRRLPLTEIQQKKIKKILKQSWEEWQANTSSLRSKLYRYNSLMEGIKEPKMFPWPGCSNLHIPLIETHITICHSVVSATMLDMDPVWYVRLLIDGQGDNVDTDIEKFLNWKCKTELNIDSALSDVYWNTYRDGTGIGDLDWVEEFEKQFDIKQYDSVEDFQGDFPDEKAAGVSKEQYKQYIKELLSEEAIQIMIEERVIKYMGPKLRVVELKDFITIPTTAPDLEYAMLVGDAFIQRGDYFRRNTIAAKGEEAWFDKDECEKMLKTNGLTDSPDDISQSQDQIEGISRTRVTKADEYYCMQGVLRVDLNGDGVEEKYLFMFHRDSDSLIRFERYPYLHNRMKYIVWRFKKRPNRLLGQSIPDQLIDINEEVDTQHNQRVDSRTVTTVPSFMKKEGSQFDPTRRDQRFYPGVTFKVTNFEEFKQVPITQTDMGQSMQEEQQLYLLADIRTGAAQSRSGRESARDPRASGKKVATLVQQSNQRLDDHMRELKIGTKELGSQILELYYQFSPNVIAFPKFNPDTKQFVQTQIMRSRFRNKNMVLEVARTTQADNPSNLVQRELTKYQLLSKDPLIGANMFRRRELLMRLLTSWRERDIEKLVPSLEDLQKELQAQSQALGPAASPHAQALGQELANSGPRKSPEGHKAIATSGSEMIAE